MFKSLEGVSRSEKRPLRKTMPRANTEQLRPVSNVPPLRSVQVVPIVSRIKKRKLILRAICFHHFASPRFDAKLFSTYLTIKRFEWSASLRRAQDEPKTNPVMVRLERFELTDDYFAARSRNEDLRMMQTPTAGKKASMMLGHSWVRPVNSLRFDL